MNMNALKNTFTVFHILRIIVIQGNNKKKNLQLIFGLSNCQSKQWSVNL